MIAKERVYTELKKTVEGENYLESFNSMYVSGLLLVIFGPMQFALSPQWEEFKIDFNNIDERSIESFFTLITIYELRPLKPNVRIEKMKELVSFYKTLKLPSKTVKDIHNITMLYFEFGLHNLIPSIRVFESKHNSLFFKLLNHLGKKSEFTKIRNIYQNNLDSFSNLVKPYVNGRDCLALEVEPFDIGKVLDVVYEKQLLGLIIDKQESLSFVKNLKAQYDSSS